jgi:hypothetical protein
MDGPGEHSFAFWERAARAALRSPSADVVGPLKVLHLVEPATAVACLVTVRPSPSGLFLPLRSGRNLVQRDYVAESKLLRGVVEGAQWLIRVTPAGATVEDTRSTNGAVLVRKANRDEVPLELVALHQSSATCRIGWDGSTIHAGPRELRDGDVLVNAYGPLMYCCTAAGDVP